MVRNIVKIDKDGYVSIYLWPHKSVSVCSVVNSYFTYCPSKLSNCCSLPDFCANLGWLGLVRSRPSLVRIVRGTDRGKPAWHYVLLDEGKENAFKEQVCSGRVNVAAYGKIIRSGWGEDPPNDVKKASDSFVCVCD